MGIIVSLIVAAFGLGAAGVAVNQVANQPQDFDKVTNAACYSIESDVTKTVTAPEISDDCTEGGGGDQVISDKTYTRLRQQVRISNEKIEEGKPNWGRCNNSPPSGYGALRNITTDRNPDTASAQVGDIFWEDKNHKRQDISDFILILTEKENGDHVFDVYADNSILNNLPEYVVNCEETGGLIPMMEGPASQTLPPQAISVKSNNEEYNSESNQTFSVSCCVPEHSKLVQDDVLSDYYIKVQEDEIPNVATKIGNLQKTVDSESKSYDVFFHTGVVYLADTEDGSSWLYNATNTQPPLSGGWQNPSLQLTTLQFITTSEWTWATPECKPALYLYPEEETELSVQVQPNGHITESIPEHGKNGWQVIAQPDGTIIDVATKPWSANKADQETAARTYPYLYYEASVNNVDVPHDAGWIKTSDQLPIFFADVLPRLGLNEKEAQDFTEYWITKLASEGDRWFITLIDQEEVNRVEPVDFSVAPDNFHRVRFYFENIDNEVIIQTPSVIQLPTSQLDRDGFTVIDWGGIMGNGSCGTEEISG